MNIKCFVDRSFLPPAPCTRALLVVKEEGIEGSVKLLIDTGASATTIMDGDVEFLGIDVQKLEKAPMSLIGIGGPVETHLMKGVELVFTTEDGGEHVELMDALIVKHDLTGISEGLRRKILAMPSLLGRDLINKRFKLLYDYNTRLVKLSLRNPLK
jgi:hypothetical protein